MQDECTLFAVINIIQRYTHSLVHIDLDSIKIRSDNAKMLLEPSLKTVS